MPTSTLKPQTMITLQEKRECLGRLLFFDQKKYIFLLYIKCFIKFQRSIS